MNIPIGQASNIDYVFIQDSSSTTGAGLTGVTSGSSGLAGRYIYPGGTSVALTFETITTLGTYQAPTSNAHLRIKELDATNHPGVYEIHYHNDWFSTANARKAAILTIKGVTNMAQLNHKVTIDYALQPATAARTLVVDASGLADANMVKVGPTGSGTTQTAGDIYSKVSGLTYTVANQVDANVKSNAGTAITSASGIQEVKVASLAAAALTSIAAAVWDALTSGMSTVGSIGKKLADWVVGTIDTYTGNTKQTGDAYARLGAPAGASVSADVAAVKSETAAILDDTGTSGVVVDAASKTGYRLSATGVDDILDEVVQGTATVRQLLGWMGASTQGVSSGYGTGTVTFYYNDGTTAALIVTISAGNRTAITRA